MEHYQTKRHKCHFCGAVRYEIFMVKLKPWETEAVSQFGNAKKCWACRESYQCNSEIRKRPANLS